MGDKKNKEASHQAYILTFPNQPDINGLTRLVKWIRGHGVLDRRAIADARPDLYNPATFEITAGWDVLSEAMKYWQDRGAEVREVSEEEAEEYRHLLETNPAKIFNPADPKKADADGGQKKTGAEKIRIHQLAKEFDMDTARVLEKLAAGGIEAQAAASTVDAGAARKILGAEEPKAAGPPHAG